MIFSMGSDPLFGAEVERALGSMPENEHGLRALTQFREKLGDELGRRAARLRELRIRSKSKFPAGWLPFLTPMGLEQSTPCAVARVRARRIGERVGAAWTWDATCGIGADAVALRELGIPVAASDRDPEAIGCARANLLRGTGPTAVVARADAAHSPIRADYVLVDPDRRAGGRRSLDPERWSPSLATALAVARGHRGACIKLPPAFDVDLAGELPGRWSEVLDGLAHSWHWVSRRGELCEVSLWTGDLAQTATPRTREASIAHESGREECLSGEPERIGALTDEQLGRIAWLAEPDPSVIRSGLLGLLAREQGMAPIAPRSAYLGGASRASTPFLRSWRVLGRATLDARKVRALLRKHDVGPLTVKKRGHPDSADVLAKRLRGKGSRRGLLAVARLERGHIAFLLEPAEGQGDQDSHHLPA